LETGGGGQKATGHLTKNCQNIIFDVMSEVQKDLEEASAGIGQLKKI
jgi:hypothetical protein